MATNWSTKCSPKLKTKGREIEKTLKNRNEGKKSDSNHLRNCELRIGTTKAKQTSNWASNGKCELDLSLKKGNCQSLTASVGERSKIPRLCNLSPRNSEFSVKDRSFVTTPRFTTKNPGVMKLRCKSEHTSLIPEELSSGYLSDFNFLEELPFSIGESLSNKRDQSKNRIDDVNGFCNLRDNSSFGEENIIESSDGEILDVYSLLCGKGSVGLSLSESSEGEIQTTTTNRESDPTSPKAQILANSELDGLNNDIDNKQGTTRRTISIIVEPLDKTLLGYSTPPISADICLEQDGGPDCCDRSCTSETAEQSESIAVGKPDNDSSSDIGSDRRVTTEKFPMDQVHGFLDDNELYKHSTKIPVDTFQIEPTGAESNALIEKCGDDFLTRTDSPSDIEGCSVRQNPECNQNTESTNPLPDGSRFSSDSSPQRNNSAMETVDCADQATASETTELTESTVDNITNDSSETPPSLDSGKEACENTSMIASEPLQEVIRCKVEDTDTRSPLVCKFDDSCSHGTVSSSNNDVKQETECIEENPDKRHKKVELQTTAMPTDHSCPESEDALDSEQIDSGDSTAIAVPLDDEPVEPSVKFSSPLVTTDLASISSENNSVIVVNGETYRLYDMPDFIDAGCSDIISGETRIMNYTSGPYNSWDSVLHGPKTGSRSEDTRNHLQVISDTFVQIQSMVYDIWNSGNDVNLRAAVHLEIAKLESLTSKLDEIANEWRTKLETAAELTIMISGLKELCESSDYALLNEITRARELNDKLACPYRSISVNTMKYDEQQHQTGNDHSSERTRLFRFLRKIAFIAITVGVLGIGSSSLKSITEWCFIPHLDCGTNSLSNFSALVYCMKNVSAIIRQFFH